MSDDGLFVIDPSRKAHEQPTATVYTVIGREDYLEEDSGIPCLCVDVEDARKNPYAHAMKLSGEGGVRFFVKQGPHGKLFNPLGFFSEGRESKMIKHAGRKEWELREVGEKAFNFYLNFLKTKNLSYINNAERELL